MTITETTKLSEIMRRYPWLLDEAVKMDNNFRILKTPIGKLFIKNATIAELSGRAGLNSEEIIVFITDMINSRRA